MSKPDLQERGLTHTIEAKVSPQDDLGPKWLDLLELGQPRKSISGTPWEIVPYPIF